MYKTSYVQKILSYLLIFALCFQNINFYNTYADTPDINNETNNDTNNDGSSSGSGDGNDVSENNVSGNDLTPTPNPTPTIIKVIAFLDENNEEIDTSDIYETINIPITQKENVYDILPSEAKVKDDNDEIQNINVGWVCDDDYENTNEETYVFNMKVNSEYYDINEINVIPYIKVNLCPIIEEIKDYDEINKIVYTTKTEKNQTIQDKLTKPISVRMNGSSEFKEINPEFEGDLDYRDLDQKEYHFKINETKYMFAEGVENVNITIREKDAITYLMKEDGTTKWDGISTYKIVNVPYVNKGAVFSQFPTSILGYNSYTDELVALPIIWIEDNDYNNTNLSEYTFTASLNIDDSLIIQTDGKMPKIKVNVVSQITSIVGETHPYYYKEIIKEEKSTMKNNLPSSIYCHLNGDNSQMIAVEVDWVCSVDYQTVDATEYIFTPKFDTQYSLADNIKNNMPYARFLVVNASGYSNKIEEYSYTNGTKTYVAPETGKYYFQLYGGAGGGTSTQYGGYGGSSYGYINLKKGDIIYVTVGGNGVMGGAGGYNGGANGVQGSGGGGGATHIASVNGLLSSLSGNKNAIIAVAGGGGGAGTNMYDRDNIIGNGGGISGGTSTVYAYDDIVPTYFKTATTSDGYAFGRGGTGSNGGGSGGGGYYGGVGVVTNRGGGNGGSGYVSTNVIDGTSAQQNSVPNGSAKIEYIGKTTTEIVLNYGDGATYNGQHKVTLKLNAGDSIILNPSVASDYTLDGYVRQYGDAQISDNTLYVGFEKTEFTASYKAPLKLTTTKNANGTIKLNYVQNDSYSKYYKAYESEDKNNWYFVNSTTISYSTKTITENFGYTGSLQTYSIPTTGIYTFKIYGASGGRAYAQGNLETKIGYGGYAEGSKELEYGNTLYIQVGGKGMDGQFNDWAYGGWNGGGKGSNDGGGGGESDDDEASGGGGGATHIAIEKHGTNGLLSDYASYKSDILLVAGGGGGATYTYGGASGGGQIGEADGWGRQATQSSGFSFGKGQDGSGVGDSDGVGGGGGGWYGGYAADESYKTWGGGGSGYVGGVINGRTTTSTHSGDGYVTISYEDKRYTTSEIDNITVRDKAAPNAPKNLQAKEENTILSWEDAGDNGTTYYHKVESYNSATGNKLHDSNITEDVITSGVKGWYYYFDTNPTGNANPLNGSKFTDKTMVEIPGVTGRIYAHVATIDNAGNLSPTVNYEIIVITYHIRYNPNYATDNSGMTNTTGILDERTFYANTNYTLKKNTFQKTGTGYYGQPINFVFVGWGFKPYGSLANNDVAHPYKFRDDLVNKQLNFTTTENNFTYVPDSVKSNSESLPYYYDEDKIYNLTKNNNEIVNLYAEWVAENQRPNGTFKLYTLENRMDGTTTGNLIDYPYDNGANGQNIIVYDDTKIYLSSSYLDPENNECEVEYQYSEDGGNTWYMLTNKNNTANTFSITKRTLTSGIEILELQFQEGANVQIRMRVRDIVKYPYRYVYNPSTQTTLKVKFQEPLWSTGYTYIGDEYDSQYKFLGHSGTQKDTTGSWYIKNIKCEEGNKKPTPELIGGTVNPIDIPDNYTFEDIKNIFDTKGYFGLPMYDYTNTGESWSYKDGKIYILVSKALESRIGARNEDELKSHFIDTTKPELAYLKNTEIELIKESTGDTRYTTFSPEDESIAFLNASEDEDANKHNPTITGNNLFSNYFIAIYEHGTNQDVLTTSSDTSTIYNGANVVNGARYSQTYNGSTVTGHIYTTYEQMVKGIYDKGNALFATKTDKSIAIYDVYFNVCDKSWNKASPNKWGNTIKKTIVVEPELTIYDVIFSDEKSTNSKYKDGVSIFRNASNVPYYHIAGYSLRNSIYQNIDMAFENTYGVPVAPTLARRYSQSSQNYTSTTEFTKEYGSIPYKFGYNVSFSFRTHGAEEMRIQFRNENDELIGVFTNNSLNGENDNTILCKNMNRKNATSNLFYEHNNITLALPEQDSSKKAYMITNFAKVPYTRPNTKLTRTIQFGNKDYPLFEKTESIVKDIGVDLVN